MKNVLELFSKGKDLSADLAEKVKKVCSIVERLDTPFFGYTVEQRKLWLELEDMLGIEVELFRQEIEGEDGQVIDSYNEYTINRRPDSLFWYLCQYLPYFSTVDWYDGKDYVVLPNGFVLELYGAGLTYSKNIDSITHQILDEIKRQEEYRKECEE